LKFHQKPIHRSVNDIYRNLFGDIIQTYEVYDFVPQTEASVYALTYTEEEYKKFLEKGNKLKLEMQLRGREKEHKERAKEIFESFVEMLRSDFSVRVESPVQYQSGRMNMIVARDK